MTIINTIRLSKADLDTGLARTKIDEAMAECRDQAKAMNILLDMAGHEWPDRYRINARITERDGKGLTVEFRLISLTEQVAMAIEEAGGPKHHV